MGVNLTRGGGTEPLASATDLRVGAGAGALPLDCAPGWVAAWNASPVGSPGGAVPGRPEIGGRSLRMIVRPRVVGSEVRLVLSNRYGADPVDLRSVSVGMAAGGPVLAGKPVPVTFDKLNSGQIPARGTLLSDPVALAVSEDTTLAVSMFVPRKLDTVSEHPWAMTTSYISDPGDFASSADGAGFSRQTNSWFVLTGIDVQAPKATNAVVMIGDSITDGMGSSHDTDRRLSDDLGDKLNALGGGREMAVLNAGIAGNQLLQDYPRFVGESALSRLSWEVPGRPRITDVILHAGTNDMAAGAKSQDIISGLIRFTERAHNAGLRVFLTTVTPANTGAHGTARAAQGRAEVNRWIRAHGREHADGVFDFAAAVTDVSNPTRLVSGFDAGDGIHLSDIGYRALAGAVDLSALSGSRCRA
jgi:lysophospholipase L1-like esterase